MGAAAGAPRTAAVMAVVSAFLWATYYFFVLTLSSGTRPAAVTAYPFLVAGLVFVGLAAYQGHFRAFLELWRSPSAYLRTLLLVGMQLSVLASTYTAGPIDTSLLSLLGDVALTPLFLMLLYREGIERARSTPFWGGLLLSSAGAALTIVGGQSTTPLHGLGWLVAPTVALTVAFYFLLTAKANISVPTTAVVAQASLAAGLVSVVVSPLLPGGFAGLWVPSLSDVALIVGLGITSFFVAPFLYFGAVERAGIFLPALLMATIPVFTLVVELAAFGVGASPLALLGVPIAVAGGLV
ncbi:MAG TPA: DMT family transporter, partial [Thermoplasmata archaeon]